MTDKQNLLAPAFPVNSVPELFAQGMRIEDIAAQVGCSEQVANDIVLQSIAQGSGDYLDYL